jgi:WD40 repeat protein
MSSWPGWTGGVLFIAMRFVAGGDLHAVIRREGPLPAPRATGHELAVITDPGGKDTASATFSPDGKTLAVGDRDGSTYLWSIQRE